MRTVIFGAICALALSLGAGFPSGHVSHGDQPPAQTTDIVIGALLSLTGDGATLGKASQAVLNIAVQEINDEFTAFGSPLRVRIIVDDTKQQPALALQSLQDLASKGAKIVVGPQTSSEVAAIKDWANANGVIVISQGSTASSLAIPNDNILRFVSDDRQEAKALTALLTHDGIQTVIPIWREDAGNQGLHDSVFSSFTVLGGTELQGVSYPPNTIDFSDTIATLAAQVRQAKQQNGTQSIAVYLDAFEEGVKIFDAAQSDPDLSSVRWYGSDGIALSDALINDPVAAAFAAKVDFPNPDFGLDDSAKDKWQPLVTKVHAQIGYDPDAFALTSYDIAWVSALAIASTNNTTNPLLLRDAIFRIADRYFGATGWTELNDAGDRVSSSDDFWAIRFGDDGAPHWVRIANYVPGIGVSSGE